MFLPAKVRTIFESANNFGYFYSSLKVKGLRSKVKGQRSKVKGPLRYAASGANLGACRAFFLIDPTKVGDGQTGSRIASFSVDFGNGETTSVIQIENGKLKVENLNSGWYTLGGMQLQGEPTEKGVYIYNGKKVVKR